MTGEASSGTVPVVVFGSLHMDVMVAAPDRPRKGETLAGHAWALKPGGKGGNQAAEAARAGARVAFFGAVGTDDFGPPLLRHLEDHGVAAEVAVRSDGGTGMSVAITDAEGDYGAVIVSGVNLGLGPAEGAAAAARLAPGGWLVLQNEIPDAANMAAAAAARARGGRVLHHAAPARPLPADLAGALDCLVVNAIEAEGLGAGAVTDLATAGAAAERLLPLAAAVVVTAGGAGVAAATADGHRIAVPGRPVRLVSTHGAGDCFIGTLAARLAAGEALEPALTAANAAAARHVAGESGPAA